jgi:hypothetical protein
MTRASCIALIAAVFASSIAGAEPGVDAGGAETLFREGKQLMKENRFAEACAKFDASDRIDRGIGTLLNLADCREKNGQIATAWATFLEAATAARTAHDSVRENEARTRASALEPRLSYLTISVPDGSKVEGLVVKRGDDTVDPALWNQGVPVDAGTYVVSGQAPGHEPWSTTITVGSAQKSSVEVPRFKRIQDLAPKAVAQTATESDDGSGDVEAHAATSQGSDDLLTPARIGSYGAAVLGLAAIGTGVGFALEARSLQHQSDSICPMTACGDDHALALNSQAQHDAKLGDIMMGAGGAVVAGAAVLWLLGGGSHGTETVSLSPNVGATHVGVSFGGRF